MPPHDRKFGVEIECGHRSGRDHIRTRLVAARIIPMKNNTVGSDGSGIEIRTPPLQGEAGFKTFRTLMDFLKEEGCFVSTSDGMHVHHDAPEFLPRNNTNPDYHENRARLKESWTANEDHIEKWVDPYRRTNAYCTKLKGRHDVYRGALNLNALAGHGTIEIRFHEGTLNADEAIAWIMFGQKFIHNVLNRKRPMPERKSPKELADKLQLRAQARKHLKVKRNSRLKARTFYMPHHDPSWW